MILKKTTWRPQHLFECEDVMFRSRRVLPCRPAYYNITLPPSPTSYRIRRALAPRPALG
eukprot:COSAG01_NODE_55008_length_328_cov_0.742358_1_plen_58_part_10